MRSRLRPPDSLWADLCTALGGRHVLSSQFRGTAEKCLSATVGIRTFRESVATQKPSSEGVRLLPRPAEIAPAVHISDQSEPGVKPRVAGAARCQR
jgi:hypothetical protein